MTDLIHHDLKFPGQIEQLKTRNPTAFGFRLRRFLSNPEFQHRPIRTIRKRLYWRLHWKLRPESPFVFHLTSGQSIRLAHSSASSGIYLNGGFSDPHLAQLFREYLAPGMIAFDCGAHIGEYTLQFARLVGPGGQVHAFEPDPRVHAYLESNVALNRLTNVVVNRLGLSNRETAATFCLQRDATTSSLQEHAETRGVQGITIQTTTLDSYARFNHLKRIDALKIDVEGAEASVLAGAQNVILRFQPGLIFVECDRPVNVTPVMEALQAAGYQVENRFDARHLHPHVVARKSKPEGT